MASLLDEQAIAAHLKMVVDDLGGRDKAADLIGIDRNSLSNYMNLSGGKKPSNVVAKLIGLGINGNWYLTGEGERYAKDSRPPSRDDMNLMEVGRGFIALIKKAQEIGTNSQSASSTQAERSGVSCERGAVVIPDALPFSGPPPSFSPEDEERLFGPSKHAARRTE